MDSGIPHMTFIDDKNLIFYSNLFFPNAEIYNN
jgi:hypothetical protein